MDHRRGNRIEGRIYRIQVQGHLDESWSEWFGGMTIASQEGDVTLLIGPVVDQPALYGLLVRIRDLGLELISVNRVEPGQTQDVLPQN